MTMKQHYHVKRRHRKRVDDIADAGRIHPLIVSQEAQTSKIDRRIGPSRPSKSTSVPQFSFHQMRLADDQDGLIKVLQQGVIPLLQKVPHGRVKLG